MAAGHPPEIGEIKDIEEWNQTHARARRGQSWETVWTDLHRVRRALLEVVKEISETALAQSFRFPWGEKGTPYQMIVVFLTHDREHAHELREAIEGQRDEPTND
jgi:hypothetical protein